jgi:nicotinamide-nucleotide amidase
MVHGALATATGTSLAVSITGIAGPGGGSADKPVGLVFFGRAIAGGGTQSWRHHFTGDRASIREQATMRALNLMIEGIPAQDHA